MRLLYRTCYWYRALTLSHLLAELRNKIIDWLGPTADVVQDDMVRGRDLQSCQWLVDRPEFLRWLELDGFTGFWLWGTR